MLDELEFAKVLACKAGDLLKGHFKIFGVQAELKADRSVVTEADLAADRLIQHEIQQYFPDDVILSEELHPGALSKEELQRHAIWVIDPLDGTTNFSLGLHIWGTLITRVIAGYPELTAMYFPVLGELYSARRSQGAWLNGHQLQVERPDSGHPLPFFACCSRTYHRYSVSVPYKTRILGSSAYTFNLVARGMAIVGFEATPKIWDIAGSWLLVQEAGGIIETLEAGNPFPVLPSVDYASMNFPTLAAANAQLAARTRSQIIPIRG